VVPPLQAPLHLRRRLQIIFQIVLSAIPATLPEKTEMLVFASATRSGDW
jgi:hypothetical protein